MIVFKFVKNGEVIHTFDDTTEREIKKFHKSIYNVGDEVAIYREDSAASIFSDNFRRKINVDD